MRYIGLDLGNRTCGVAISDSMGIIATSITIKNVNTYLYSHFMTLFNLIFFVILSEQQ